MIKIKYGTTTLRYITMKRLNREKDNEGKR